MLGSEMSIRLGRSRLSSARRPRGPLLVYVGTFCYLVTVFGNVNPLRKLVLGLPVLVLIGALADARTRERLRRGIVPLGLTAFLAWMGISYFWSVDRHNSGHQILEVLLVSIAGGFLACSLHRHELIHMIALATRISVAITAASLVVAHHWATKTAVGATAGWHGPFGQKNSLGFALAIGLVAMYFESPRPRRYLAWMLVAIALLVGSHSAGSWVSTLVAAAVLAWITLAAGTPTVRRRLLLMAGSLVALALAVWFLVADFRTVAGVLGKKPNLTGRTSIWDAVVNAFYVHPWHGYGYGAVWLNSSGETARLWHAIGFRAYEAHEVWLDLLLQVGVVGCLLMVLVLAGAFTRSLRMRPWELPTAAWLLMTLVVLVVDGFVESDLIGDTMFLVAVVIIATRIPYRHQGGEPGIAAGEPSGQALDLVGNLDGH
ncbi:MAG: O-antigen ligase family protein [Acidimicrobiales bacterium]